jgi:hypothetical protein
VARLPTTRPSASAIGHRRCNPVPALRLQLVGIEAAGRHLVSRAGAAPGAAVSRPSSACSVGSSSWHNTMQIQMLKA